MPDEVDVPGNERIAPEVADKGQGKDETVNISKAELEGLHRSLRESQQSERDWAGIAKRGTREPDPIVEQEEQLDPAQFSDPDEPGIADDTPEKLVDDLAAQGVAALGKRGFITAADAKKIAVDVAAKVTRELIGRERTKMGTDAILMNDFPEFKDLMSNPAAQAKSELWQETAKIYQKAVSMDPSAKKTPAALYLAAQAARETLKARAPRRAAAEVDDEGVELEDDRRRRAESQDSRPRARGTVDDRDDLVGPQARQLMKAMGVTEAEYKESQRELLGTRGKARR
jgi:hypothetical protein